MTFSFDFPTATASATPLKSINVLGSVLVLITVVASGCSSHTGYAIGTLRNDSPVRSENIEVLDNAHLDDYYITGRVHAHSWAPLWLPWLLKSQDELISKLAIEASLLGADAIVDVRRYSRSQFEWREEHLMGTAVTLRNRDDSDAP